MKRLPRLLLLALSPAFAAPAISVSAQSVSVGYSPSARSAPLGSTYVDWATLSFRPSPVGLYCAVFDEPTPTLERLEVHITTLRPGMASHTPHHHPWEEMLLIRAGQVEVSLTSSRSKRLKPLWPGFPSDQAACAAGSSDGFAVRRPG